MRITRRAVLATALRVVISGVLIGAVLVALRSERIAVRDLWPGAGHAAAALLLWAAGLATLAARFRLLVGAEGMRVSTTEALRLTLEGHALGQVSPGLVGGDIWRSVRLARAGLATAASVRVVVLDRLVGLAGLGLTAWLAWTATFAARGQPLLAALAALAAALAFAVFLARAWLARLVSDRHRLIDAMLAHLTDSAHRRDMPAMLVLSVAVHLLNATAFLAIGRGLGLDVAPLAGLAVLSIAFFLAALPVAFGGWGAREAAIAAGFAALGLAPGPAVATSIAFGLMLVAAGVPGLALVVLPWRRAARPA